MKKFTFEIVILLLLNLIFGFAKAQVVYTDVNPDTIIHEFTPFPPISNNAGGSTSYDLDVNNDGIIDFRFLISGFLYDYNTGSTYLEAYVYLDSCACDLRNEVVFDSLNHQKIEVAPLNYSDQIINPLPQSQNYPFQHFDSIYNFSSTSFYKYEIAGYHYDDVSGTSSNQGPWNHVVNNKYLGLKFYLNNVAYFGWVRISIYLLYWNPYFTIHEYAYEASGGSITAGAGSTFTGIEEIKKNDFNIFPNPANNNFVITSPNNKIETLKVFDTFGKLILQKQINSGNTILNAESWSSGIYFLQIYDGENTIVKKLIKSQ